MGVKNNMKVKREERKERENGSLRERKGGGTAAALGGEVSTTCTYIPDFLT